MTTPIEDALKAANAEVEQLRTRLGEGIASDVGVLQPLLDHVMKTLQAMPVAEAKPYTEQLYELATSLGELQTDFTRQQNAAQDAMEHINARLKAAVAYARSNATK